MQISWIIKDVDIQKVKNVIRDNDNSFVRSRIELNVKKKNISITKDRIIKTLMMCLLTSQQRSGPNSNVSNFLNQKPFPINNEIISKTKNTEVLIKQILKKNELPRYINKTSQSFSENIENIKKDDWKIIEKLKYLNQNQSKLAERQLADFLNDWLKGFGPKQSRNFLQALGLTKFEIPIDSRITGWLNKFGFPLSLKSTPLSDKEYYHFVSDGIQELCLKVGIYPCELDAAIFSSYDDNLCTKENIAF